MVDYKTKIYIFLKRIPSFFWTVLANLSLATVTIQQLKKLNKPISFINHGELKFTNNLKKYKPKYYEV